MMYRTVRHAAVTRVARQTDSVTKRQVLVHVGHTSQAVSVLSQWTTTTYRVLTRWLSSLHRHHAAQRSTSLAVTSLVLEVTSCSVRMVRKSASATFLSVCQMLPGRLLLSVQLLIDEIHSLYRYQRSSWSVLQHRAPGSTQSSWFIGMQYCSYYHFDCVHCTLKHCCKRITVCSTSNLAIIVF